MNVHHLELFYYVARYGGVIAAVRRMPYGIQQPAVSAQIIQLEDSLGTTLFHRRPFALTRTGAELYAHLQPFFEKLPEVTDRLRGDQPVHLKIGAPETVRRLIVHCVSRGFGAGLTLTAHPGVPAGEGTRRLALDDFPMISYGALWLGKATPLQQAFVEETAAEAGSLAKS